MAYDKMITRENASALQADQKLINEIITGVTTGSTVLPLMRKLPNMTGKTASIPVLSSLPEAYWVDGDNGLKQTTNAMWKNKKITAEEIAVVVPIPEAVLADSEYDIWAEIKPQIVEQFYKKIDEAIISGKDKPTSFREGLIPSIITAGNNVAYGSDTTVFERLSDTMSKVEEDGFDVTAILGGVGLKGAFRKGLVDTTGQPLTNSDVSELPRAYARNGAWNNELADFVVGDFKQAVYAIRQDIEFKLFDSGVVTDNEGNIIYNLMQQDMVALRVTLRMGWELPNPVTALNGDEATRFPFALAKAQ